MPDQSLRTSASTSTEFVSLTISSPVYEVGSEPRCSAHDRNTLNTSNAAARIYGSSTRSISCATSGQLCNAGVYCPPIRSRPSVVGKHLELHPWRFCLRSLDHGGHTVIRRASLPDRHAAELKVRSFLEATARLGERCHINDERLADIRASLAGRLSLSGNTHGFSPCLNSGYSRPPGRPKQGSAPIGSRPNSAKPQQS